MYQLISIRDDYSSYQQLINFYHANIERYFDTIEVKLVRWFSANMCSTLGAELDEFGDNINTIKISAQPPIETILLKNDFLSYFGYPKKADNYHTTIKYLKLKPTDGKFFNNYVFNELLGRDELPKMTQPVKERIAEAIYEIFVNAKIHSQSAHIYTCGQYFPKKDLICFTITDMGLGIKKKVNQRFNSNLSATQAITWAVQQGNTTKQEITGGIGLAVLKEFVALNKGKMQIVSDDGFYEFGPMGENVRAFSAPFPGTIVTLQFRTDDATSYILNEEVDTSSIF